MAIITLFYGWSFYEYCATVSSNGTIMSWQRFYFSAFHKTIGKKCLPFWRIFNEKSLFDEYNYKVEDFASINPKSEVAIICQIVNHC